MLRLFVIIPLTFLTCIVSAQDAVEAAASCIVVHEQSEADADVITTCFENISLERTSFESGVCQWKSEAQAATDVQTTTTFLPHCPTTYTAFCDVLVLGPQVVVPVKIFLYDKSPDVLERAQAQCMSGGGKWQTNDRESD